MKNKIIAWLLRRLDGASLVLIARSFDQFGFPDHIEAVSFVGDEKAGEICAGFIDTMPEPAASQLVARMKLRHSMQSAGAK